MMRDYRMRILLSILLTVFIVFACVPKELPPEPRDEQVAMGRDLFFKETFDGNGRTCGTCHPAANNFTLDQDFIATLPPDDPLFVAENNPDLENNFENPLLMREFSLIIENLDGFQDLDSVFTMRGIPHTLGLSTSLNSDQGPMTGWSGDGAPGDRSLRSFATGAVIQHFTLSTDRLAGIDFRLPTDEELDALEAFQLSLGRKVDPQLPMTFRSKVVMRGQQLFNDPTTGKCFACHFNAGANAAPALFGADAGNRNFNTGVEDLPDQPADMTGELIPVDDGFGTPGNGEFNTPSLVEAADTPPFFHNNSVETLEGAVAFYNGDAFNNSPAGQLVIDATGSGINLDATQVEAITAFLRVINVLDNMRQTSEYLTSNAERDFLGNVEYRQLLDLAIEENEDALEVLDAGGLHPAAIQLLNEVEALIMEAKSTKNYNKRRDRARDAIAVLDKARDELLESP